MFHAYKISFTKIVFFVDNSKQEKAKPAVFAAE